MKAIISSSNSLPAAILAPRSTSSRWLAGLTLALPALFGASAVQAQAVTIK